MASFFGKAKGSFASGSNSKQPAIAEKAETSTKAEGEDHKPSDFERTFRPFTLKKGAELAPVNWFRDAKAGKIKQKQNQGQKTVIVIDEDDLPPPCSSPQQQEDIVMADETSLSSGLDLGQMMAEGQLLSCHVATGTL